MLGRYWIINWKNIRRLILALFVSAISCIGYGQSIDERIGNAMNNGEWRFA